VYSDQLEDFAVLYEHPFFGSGSLDLLVSG